MADIFWLLVYYYHSRRTPVNAGARGHGWTGYTGVLQEMILEVPTRGNDRLERKLSLDIHYFIPTLVKHPGRRGALITTAKCLATWCDCKLDRISAAPFTSAHPELAPVERTPVEPTPVEPTPVELAPLKPSPVKPTRVERPSVNKPVPVEPASVESAPATLPFDTTTWRERVDSLFGFGYGRIRLEDEENWGRKTG